MANWVRDGDGIEVENLNLEDAVPGHRDRKSAGESFVGMQWRKSPLDMVRIVQGTLLIVHTPIVAQVGNG